MKNPNNPMQQSANFTPTEIFVLLMVVHFRCPDECLPGHSGNSTSSKGKGRDRNKLFHHNLFSVSLMLAWSYGVFESETGRGKIQPAYPPEVQGKGERGLNDVLLCLSPKHRTIS